MEKINFDYDKVMKEIEGEKAEKTAKEAENQKNKPPEAKQFYAAKPKTPEQEENDKRIKELINELEKFAKYCEGHLIQDLKKTEKDISLLAERQSKFKKGKIPKALKEKLETEQTDESIIKEGGKEINLAIQKAKATIQDFAPILKFLEKIINNYGEPKSEEGKKELKWFRNLEDRVLREILPK